MDSVTTLLAEAQAAGLKVKAEGNKLVIRGPKVAEPLALKLIEHKVEVLRLLAPEPSPLPVLMVKTVVEVLGPRPTTREIQVLGIEVAEALDRLRQEVVSGQLRGHPLLVRGVPLGALLPVEELARQLRQAEPAPQEEEGSCFVCGSTRWWCSRAGKWTCGTCHPPAVSGLAAGWRGEP